MIASAPSSAKEGPAEAGLSLDSPLELKSSGCAASRRRPSVIWRTAQRNQLSKDIVCFFILPLNYLPAGRRFGSGRKNSV